MLCRTKESVLGQIYSRMSTTKDIFGRPLPFYSTMIAVLSGSSSAHTAPLFVKVSAGALVAFRRAQRLGMFFKAKSDDG